MMLRRYPGYKNIKGLRRNMSGNTTLVRRKDGTNTYCLLTTLIVTPDNSKDILEKQQISSKLNHRNVHNTLEVFMNETKVEGGASMTELVIVSQFCEDLVLGSKVGKMNNKQLIVAMLDIAQGLTFLHQQVKIVHRKIGLDSIWLKDGRCVISDYSLAKKIDGGQLARGIVGKIYYASPEMLNCQPYDFKSDVWTLGILFIELLLGKPFRKIMLNVPSSSSQFPQNVISQISDDKLKPLLREILERNVLKRIESHQVRSFLRQLVDKRGLLQLQSNGFSELRTLSDTVRLVIDQERNIFAMKIFNFSKQRDHDYLKLLENARHPNVIRVIDAKYLANNQCQTIEEYSEAGSLVSALQNLSIDEVTEYIKNLWNGFKFLRQSGLLIAQNVNIDLVLIKEAKAKLPLYSRFTFGSRTPENPSQYYGIRELAHIYLQLAMNTTSPADSIEKYKQCQLPDQKLSQIIEMMLEPANFDLQKLETTIHAYYKYKSNEDRPVIYRNYRVLKEISRGAVATVYLAERNNEQYALKLILCAQEQERNQALNQAKFLSMCNHENIVKCYEYFMNENETEVIIIMEYCQEHTLKEMIGNIPKEKRLKFFSHLCHGVDYLHNKLKIVHRDLKPTNILIRNDILKIGDFGRAYEMKEGERLTAAVGSKFYMCPEMANAKPYTINADEWNLGVLGLEIVLNRLVGNNNMLANDMQFPDAALFDISDETIRKLLRGMIERDPEKRLLVRHVLEQLDRFIE